MDLICRVCARSNDFQSFDLTMVSQITQVRIDDMLVYCTQQEITAEDSFPQQICAECFATLNSAFLFRNLTYQSAASFQENIDNNVFTVATLEASIEQEVAIPSATELIIKEEQMDTIEEELLEISDPIETNKLQDTDEASVPMKKKKRNPVGTMLTYLCRECLYSTPHSHNFKRHQKLTRHSSSTHIRISKPIRRIPEILPPPDPSVTPMQCQRSASKKTTLYRCTECGFQSFVQHNFRRHQISMEHSSQVKFTKPFSEAELAHLHKCPACGDLFASAALLANHTKNAIANGSQGKSNDDLAAIKIEDLQDPNEASVQTKKRKRRPIGTFLTYVCQECFYSTRHSNNFKRHQKTNKHSSFTKIRGKSVKRFSEILPDTSTVPLQCQRSTNKKTLYRCTECSFQTFVQHNFRRHQITMEHSSHVKFSEPFSETELAHLHRCPACGDLFASAAHLDNHTRKAIQQQATSEDVSMANDTTTKSEAESEEAEQSDPFGDS